MNSEDKNKEINKKIENEIFIVYFSSISNNTHRFIEKLNFKNKRIPINLDEEINVSDNYILITPTYGGGGDDYKNSVPKQVIKFLNKKSNRILCKAVIASGNTNFGNTFAAAGTIISKKLNIPLLYQFELLGTKEDVKKIKFILKSFWKKERNN